MRGEIVAQELGALAVSMPPSDPINPAKLQLVEDLWDDLARALDDLA